MTSNWENLCLLRMSSITPHQTTARPVLRESQERWEKSLVSVFVHKHIQQLKDCISLSLTLWIHLPALQVNVSIHIQKYDYCPIKSSFCMLRVPSVFLVTVTYSSCHEPDRNFLVSYSILFTISFPFHPPIKSKRLPVLSLSKCISPRQTHRDLREKL